MDSSQPAQLELFKAILNKNLDEVKKYTCLVNLNQVLEPINRLPLHTAIMVGDLQIVDHLLKSGADSSLSDHRTVTPLHEAIEFSKKYETDELKMIKLLISHHDLHHNHTFPDFINAKNSLQKTPILHAYSVLRDHIHQLDVISLLIDKNADLNIKDKYGNTILLEAVKKNDAVICEFLLSKELSEKQVFHDENVKMALVCAIAGKSTDIMKLILKNYEKAIQDTDGVELNSLHTAIQYGDLAGVELILKYNVNLETKNIYGSSPLQLAYQYAGTDKADALINAGASLTHIGSEGRHILFYALASLNLENVSHLLRELSKTTDLKSVLQVRDNRGDNAITFLSNHAAGLPWTQSTPTAAEKVATMLLILEKFLEIDEKIADSLDSELKTPLLSIMTHQETIFQPIIDLLLPKTSNFTAKTSTGETCLILAAKSANFETLKILIESGADIRESCSKGGNALQAAMSAGNQEIVDYLVEKGCSINLSSEAKGKAAIDVSRYAKNNNFFQDLIDKKVSEMNISEEDTCVVCMDSAQCEKMVETVSILKNRKC